jgi:hypothetical protein
MNLANICGNHSPVPAIAVIQSEDLKPSTINDDGGVDTEKSLVCLLVWKQAYNFWAGHFHPPYRPTKPQPDASIRADR